MDPLIAAWARAFVFTQLVEVPIYRGLAKVPLGLAFAASAITHPIVWFVFFSERVPLGYDAKLGLAETFAVVVEAAVLATTKMPARRALGFALLANAASVVTSMATRAAFGWP